MKKLSALFLIFAALSCGKAQSQPVSSGNIIPLYSEAGKSSVPEGILEGTDGLRTLYNVSTPTLEVFIPENPCGAAVLVCPGGGFMILSYDAEGTLVGKKLAERGITAFVLKYRTLPLLNENGTPASNLPEVLAAFGREAEKAQKSVGNNSDVNLTDVTGTGLADLADGSDQEAYRWASTIPATRHAYEDADAAMAWIWTHAGEYGIKKDKIGIMGFSAGAITSLHQVQFHSKETRPAFAGIIYGGWDDSFSIPKDGMPLFMCSPTKDNFSPAESLRVFLGWRKAGFPAEHHFFFDATHGFGATDTGKSVDCWVDLFRQFLKDQKIITR